MSKGKQPQRKIELPKGWWLRLGDICRTLWGDRETHLDIYGFTGISRRSFAAARSSGKMTEELFAKLTKELGYKYHQHLLDDLGTSNPISRPATPIPKGGLSLTTQRANPQWADYRDYLVGSSVPWALECRVATVSPYFRFGFKLLGEEGRVFGDGSIKSHDANLIVHIGRNNWDRPGITAQDVFLTAYMSGNFIEENDRRLFRSKLNLVVPIKLEVNRSYSVNIAVNGQSVFERIVSPAICRRVALYAWGDREEFRVDVTDLIIKAS